MGVTGGGSQKRGREWDDEDGDDGYGGYGGYGAESYERGGKKLKQGFGDIDEEVEFEE
jgi:hypothetical protein